MFPDMDKASEREKGKGGRVTKGQREARLRRRSRYEKNKRSQETREERAERLASARAYRAEETEEERAGRLANKKVYDQIRRSQETAHQKAKRLAKQREYSAQKRAQETVEEKKERLARKRRYRVQKRVQESEEQRMKNQEERREYDRNRLTQETDEHKKERLKKQREYDRARKPSEVVVGHGVVGRRSEWGTPRSLRGRRKASGKRPEGLEGQQEHVPLRRSKRVKKGVGGVVSSGEGSSLLPKSPLRDSEYRTRKRNEEAAEHRAVGRRSEWGTRSLRGGRKASGKRPEGLEGQQEHVPLRRSKRVKKGVGGVVSSEEGSSLLPESPLRDSEYGARKCNEAVAEYGVVEVRSELSTPPEQPKSSPSFLSFAEIEGLLLESNGSNPTSQSESDLLPTPLEQPEEDLLAFLFSVEIEEFSVPNHPTTQSPFGCVSTPSGQPENPSTLLSSTGVIEKVQKDSFFRLLG